MVEASLHDKYSGLETFYSRMKWVSLAAAWVIAFTPLSALYVAAALVFVAVFFLLQLHFMVEHINWHMLHDNRGNE